MTKSGFAQQILTPAACAFLVGVPDDREGFKQARTGCYNSLAERFRDWPHYNFEIARPLQKFYTRMSPLGLHIHQQATCDDFAEVVAREDIRVIILFTHYDEGVVEMLQGFVAVDDLAAVVPQAYADFFDISTCYGSDLSAALKRRCPCTVKWITTKIIPRSWLHFYTELFSTLAEGKHTYLTAIEYTLHVLKKRWG